MQHHGNEVKYTFNGQILPVGENSVSLDRIDLWYAKQREIVEKEVEQGGFSISDKVNLFVENEKNNGYRFVAEGVMTLDENKLAFDTDWTERPKDVKSRYGVNCMTYDVNQKAGFEPVEDEFRHIEFPIRRCDTVANMPGMSIDMYDDKHVYRFMFAERMPSTKYVLYIEQMFKSDK